MWIFTVDGFFSVVEDRNDTHYVIVRGRFEEDLRLLSYKITGRHSDDVRHTPDADYPYRITVSKRAWAKYVGQVAMGIDYDNFKARVLGNDYVSDRSGRYHDVWAAMRGGYLVD